MVLPKLTEHLLSLKTTPSYTEATQHPFLTQAGHGSLPIQRLALWLSQDRIYAAHAYPRFIGTLISRIPFHKYDAIDGNKEAQKQHILQVLVKCLDNIVLEIDFFKNTASDFSMDLEGWVERKGTRDYTAEMARVSSSSSLEEGLIFLWAMEKVYFDAWSYVRTLQSEIQFDSTGNTSAVAVQKFAANRTTPEFGAFVDTLRDLVDGLGFEPGSDGWSGAQDVWMRVIELEVGFWPTEEEVSMKIA